MDDVKILGAETLGAALRARRHAKGWSARHLAEQVGCSGTMITLVETGKRVPYLPMLLRVLEALDLEIVLTEGTP